MFTSNKSNAGKNPLSPDYLYSNSIVCNRAINHSNYILDKELNSLGFRSQEFTKDHKGTHVIFAGCSYTFGVGTLLEDTWSKKTYNKIMQEKDVSGYFNIGSPGEPIYSCIINIFKYIKNYGNPDYIFLNVPEIKRFYEYDSKDNAIYRSHTEENKILNLLAYQYYFMLNEYCIANNIAIISFTWYLGHKEHCLDIFDTFYKIELDDISEYVLSYSQQNNEDDFVLKARDGAHLGNAYHDYWHNFIYNKYVNIRGAFC